jgi:type I restriction enzyme S subunit
MSNRGGNDWRFLYFLLQHLQLTGLNSHSTVPGLNRESVYSIELAFPPKFEQEKIAAVLWKIQKAVEMEDAIVRNARDLKKSLLRYLFTHGLRGEPLKETEIGPLAASWSVSSLESVATFASGGTPSKERSEFWSGTVPWVSPKDLKRARLYDVQDHISEDGLAAGSTRVPIGTLLVVIRGMILNRDLPVAMAMKPMAFNQDIKAVLPTDRVNADFLLYIFESGKRRLFNQIGTSAHGTRTLMSDYLAKFKLPLPPISEQQEIAAILQTVDRKIDIHESKKRSLQDLSKTTLHQLMTAQIRVSDLDIDTSEVSA